MVEKVEGKMIAGVTKYQFKRGIARRKKRRLKKHRKRQKR
jgi:hypothetical protein